MQARAEQPSSQGASEEVPNLLQIHPAPNPTMTNPLPAKPFPGTDHSPPSSDTALGTKDQRSPTAQELLCLPYPGKFTGSSQSTATCPLLLPTLQFVASAPTGERLSCPRWQPLPVLAIELANTIAQEPAHTPRIFIHSPKTLKIMKLAGQRGGTNLMKLLHTGVPALSHTIALVGKIYKHSRNS